jgi:septal ring factor EnvC (AmiA/AmiB activator)
VTSQLTSLQHKIPRAEGKAREVEKQRAILEANLQVLEHDNDGLEGKLKTHVAQNRHLSENLVAMDRENNGLALHLADIGNSHLPQF